MLPSDAIAHIQRRLGYRSDKATEILQELNDAQDRLEQGGVSVALPNGVMTVFLPWFLVTEIATATTVADEERIPVPLEDETASPRKAGFLREFDPDALWYFNPDAEEDQDEWVVLRKGDMDILRDTYPTPGPPKAYTLAGNYFRISPIPDDAYAIKIMYYGTDAPMTAADTSANKWMTYCPLLVIGEAGKIVATNLRDKGAIDSFSSDIAREALKLWTTNEARDDANRTRVMGGED